MQVDWGYPYMGAGPIDRNYTIRTTAIYASVLIYQQFANRLNLPTSRTRTKVQLCRIKRDQRTLSPKLSHKSHAISVSLSNRCRESNGTSYGDCIVCGKSNEQIRETAVLAFLESTTSREESSSERQRKREAFIAGIETSTDYSYPGECRRVPPAMEALTKFLLTVKIQIRHQEGSLYEIGPSV